MREVGRFRIAEKEPEVFRTQDSEVVWTEDQPTEIFSPVVQSAR